MRSILLAAMLLISPAFSLFAQKLGAFGTYTFPYDAEAIRLGGVYSAVGRGLATMHSNSAALAFQQGAQLQFSTGRSLLLENSDFDTPYSVAAAVHIPAWHTTVGISLDDDEWEFEPDNTNDAYLFHFHDTRLGIHLAQRMNEWLALGIALRRYRSAPKQLSPVRENTDVNAVIWDLALSLHGKHRAASIGRPSDEFHYGITVDNLLGSEIWYRDENLKDPITQEATLAAAYFWNPELGRVLRANVLSALLAVEGSLQGTKHEFQDWGTLGCAAELRILEVLLLSAGIENIVRLGNRYSHWPEYPVLRYGAGLDIPLDRLFDLDVPVDIQIDYAHTTWNRLAEDELFWKPDDYPQQLNALSLQIKADVF